VFLIVIDEFSVIALGAFTSIRTGNASVETLTVFFLAEGFFTIATFL
jgi:hypothetical protein